VPQSAAHRPTACSTHQKLRNWKVLPTISFRAYRACREINISHLSQIDFTIPIEKSPNKYNYNVWHEIKLAIKSRKAFTKKLKVDLL
jgi:hypothetical protein